jgi:N-acetylmuramoyl-L-alanine amidase
MILSKLKMWSEKMRNDLYKKFIVLFFAILLSYPSMAQNFSGIKICIDPGHGAYGSEDRYIPATGFWESESNWIKANYLKDILSAKNATVILTRNCQGTGCDISLSARVAVANNNNADYFHSIHSNAANALANYTVVFFRGANDNSPAWPQAKQMGGIMSNEIYKVNYTTAGYNRSDYGNLGFYLGVLSGLNMPGTLSEGSFHDYIIESWRLMNNEYKKHESWAIARSFQKFYNKTDFPTGIICGFVRDQTKITSYPQNSALTHDKYVPINGVKATIVQLNKVYNGDSKNNGFYFFENIAPGTYDVKLEAKGYKNKTISVTVSANVSVREHIYLDTAAAVPTFQTLWERCSRASSKPAWFGSNTERGIAYTNGKLYVASRGEGSPKIKILNALTGQDIGELNMNGVSGGTYAINDVESSWDGKIFGCNLTTNAKTSPFKIYVWNSDNSAAELFISFAASEALRLGDNFTVYGSYSSNAAIYASAQQTSKVFRWLIVNGTLQSQTPEIITLQNLTLGYTPSVAPFGYDANSDFYVNALGIQVSLFGANGQNKGSISGSVIPTGSSSIKTFVKDSKRFLAAFQFNNTAGDPNGQNVRIVEVTAGSSGVSESDVYGVTPRLGDDNNANGTGDFAYWADGQGNYVIFVLATNSGLGAYWCKAEPLYNGGSLTDVEKDNKTTNLLASEYWLQQNFPNPFNPQTIIEFNLPSDGETSLKVYDLLGKEVFKIYEGRLNSGLHRFTFNAMGLNSGVYIYKLTFEGKSISRKMLYIK